MDKREETNLETQDFELHQLHLVICAKLRISGGWLGMKMGGAEWDTVGVQGPVGRGGESVVWGIDGMGVDVQVVGELIQVVLGGKDGRSEAREIKRRGGCRGERSAHGRRANATCTETVEKRGAICGGHWAKEY